MLTMNLKAKLTKNKGLSYKAMDFPRHCMLLQQLMNFPLMYGPRLKNSKREALLPICKEWFKESMI